MPRAASAAGSRCGLAIATIFVPAQALKAGICCVRAKPAPIIPMRMVLSAVIYPVLAKVGMLTGRAAKRLSGVDVILIQADLCSRALRRPRELFRQQRCGASHGALTLILTESE